MKKRGYVYAITILALGWMWFVISPAGAREGNGEFYQNNCRVNPQSEQNVVIDQDGDRAYYNVDQKVLWEIANDFCVSLDLLVAYNFILVPREPVQYIYIKLPPGPEELGWFPGRSLHRNGNLSQISQDLFLAPADPRGPEQFEMAQEYTDPFYDFGYKQSFNWPISLQTGVVSQLYHRNHHGVDIATEIGTPVNSMGNGWVIRVEPNHHIFGQLIVIDHGDDLMGVYGHLSEISVENGDFVWQGQRIGKSGNSGRSSAPHLHVELRKTFRYVDPCDYLQNCPLAAFHGPRPTEAPPTPYVVQVEEPEPTSVAYPPAQQPSTGAVHVPNPQNNPPAPPPEKTPEPTPVVLPSRPVVFPATSTPTP